MAKRFTYTTKWDDDWYLSLSPRLKLAWNYICEQCDGVGFHKLSLGLMSYRIGEPIIEEEFAAAFADRIHWVTPDTIWIVGFIRAQYKKLSPKNKAHVNMAMKVVTTIGDAPLAIKAQEALDPLVTLLRESMDPQPTLDGPSAEGQGRDIGYRIQDTGKSILEEGCGEKPFRVSASDLEELYQAYPRKEGKSEGIAKLKAQLKSQFDVDDFRRAVDAYKSKLARDGTEKKFIKLFSSFVSGGRWRDCLDPSYGDTVDFSAASTGSGVVGYRTIAQMIEDGDVAP